MIVPELKVGVVGCGSFGRNAYVRNILSYPGATVSAACDTVAGRLDQLIDTCFSGDDAPAPPTLYNDHRALRLLGQDDHLQLRANSGFQEPDEVRWAQWQQADRDALEKECAS